MAECPDPSSAGDGSAAAAGGLDPGRIACLFSTSGHSGVDRIAQHLLPAMARRGYRVDQLKVRRHGPELADWGRGVRVVDLGSRHTYACLPAIARYLRRDRPAVLLSDKDRVNRLALVAQRLAGVPTRLVFRFGTTVSLDLASRGLIERLIQRASMGRLYPLADRVIVPSRGVADDMTAYTGLARERIRVVPSPIVPGALFGDPPPPPAHPWFHQPGVPLILSSGELCARKDFETLLWAFARVRSARPCRLMILGRGRKRSALEALARSLGVEHDFTLPGFIPSPYAYMAHADLFVLSSRWEGLGVVLIEALALGTPVVSTDCPSGPSEILQNGRYGALVPVGDDVALAAAVTATLDARLPQETLYEAARPYEIEAATDAYLAAMNLPRLPGQDESAQGSSGAG